MAFVASAESSTLACSSFMNSFNDLNGIPATGDTYLQRTVLKENWNFDGFIVSDWGSITEMIAHGHAKDGEHAAELALNAGSDMDMESYLYVKHLENLVGDYVFNPVKGTAQFTVTEPLEVMEIGTGYMMVKREVFPKFAEHYPNLKYKPDHVGQAHFDGTRYIHAYFDTVIDKESERYLSEDYMFCQLWRKTGGSIWLCPWMKTQHVGSYAFTGNMQSIANHTGNL